MKRNNKEWEQDRFERADGHRADKRREQAKDGRRQRATQKRDWSGEVRGRA